VLAHRTLALQLGLAAALVALLVVAIDFGRRGDDSASRLGARGRTTVLVLDVSSSIRPRVFRQIDRTLERGVREGGRMGVVLFSDSAYELLPPGTSSRELEPLRRYFTPVQDVQAGVQTIAVGDDRFPLAPWSRNLSSGTRISAGLELAYDVLRRYHVANGEVLLVSDLGDEFVDLPAVARAIEKFESARVPLRVVALSPRPDDERIFRRLLDSGRGTVERAPDPNVAVTTGGSDVVIPRGLLAAVLAFVLVVGANERLLARLPLRLGETGRG
jgi:hypothetical protein